MRLLAATYATAFLSLSPVLAAVRDFRRADGVHRLRDRRRCAAKLARNEGDLELADEPTGDTNRVFFGTQ